MRVLLLFIDGLGLGERDPQKNPLARYASRWLQIFTDEPATRLPGGGIVVPTHVDMGIAGLPQSATGQTALFTGRNAAAAVGHHVSGLPTPTLRRLLDEASLFKTVAAQGRRGVFANALSHEYFERRGEHISASTRALLAGGFPWLSQEDLCAGRAVSHDLTNQFLRELGAHVPLRTPAESARILATLAQQNDFTLFEFFLTDVVGHSRDFEEARRVVEHLDVLLETVLATIDPAETIVALTSDHGNFEDLSVKTHTLNLVPTIFWHVPPAFPLPATLRIEAIAPLLCELLAL
ncbi:MAG: hypothetical protein ONB48_03535 [candidate division KSB1 bacterium]|nr:hypothetical protein [candidate division KSB1 bacterium]MDZ7275588.1 hypothetical protein [candidate division KSB1 bacterium]MDZ7284721.1 hypothetical protein [candidate division KSB1 bacterium]MDZ7297860.1 hypothetical protein [candidate division KSB1 bacterium]MDZ7309557.1 hypothetical protein [candidate division KSB1 bacterium]